MAPPIRVALLLLLLIAPTTWGQPDAPPSSIDDPFDGMNLEQARKSFTPRPVATPALHSTLRHMGYGTMEVPLPPLNLFSLIRFPGPKGQYTALITHHTGDSQKRPAVLWAHSGWGGLDAAMWATTPPPPDTDDRRIPYAFADSGYVVMAPSWRGENKNPGQFELYWGEVDDLLAALAYLREQPFVDKDRVYLAGNAQGATLVLLAAEISSDFRAAFAIGATLDVEAEVKDPATELTFPPFDPQNDLEGMLRSPMPWALSIARPTFLFESTEESVLLKDAEDMMNLAKAGAVPFRSFPVHGFSHQELVVPIAQFIVEQIARDTDVAADVLLDMATVEGELYSYLSRLGARAAGAGAGADGTEELDAGDNVDPEGDEGAPAQETPSSQELRDEV